MGRDREFREPHLEVRLMAFYVNQVNCSGYNSSKKIKIFICGEYEFEAQSYRISGASGKVLS